MNRTMMFSLIKLLVLLVAVNQGLASLAAPGDDQPPATGTLASEVTADVEDLRDLLQSTSADVTLTVHALGEDYRHITYQRESHWIRYCIIAALSAAVSVLLGVAFGYSLRRSAV